VQDNGPCQRRPASTSPVIPKSETNALSVAPVHPGPARGVRQRPPQGRFLKRRHRRERSRCLAPPQPKGWGIRPRIPARDRSGPAASGYSDLHPQHAPAPWRGDRLAVPVGFRRRGKKYWHSRAPLDDLRSAHTGQTGVTPRSTSLHYLARSSPENPGQVNRSFYQAPARANRPGDGQRARSTPCSPRTGRGVACWSAAVGVAN